LTVYFASLLITHFIWGWGFDIDLLLGSFIGFRVFFNLHVYYCSFNPMVVVPIKVDDAGSLFLALLRIWIQIGPAFL